MRILVTNDDGIYSPGLAALAKAATRFGEVQIVAPDVEQSSMGHAITSGRPLNYRKALNSFGDIHAFRVNGTPADCVALGLHIAQTDVVLSGINLGLNLGNSIWHSGTLAAAKQAVLLGKKGIAFSAHSAEAESNYDTLDEFITNTLQLLLNRQGPYLFNVNFPHQPQGIQWTRQSVRFYDGKIVPGMDPMGRKHYWFTVIPLEPAEEGTDRWAVEHGFVSITPLRIDLTDEEELNKMKQ